MTRSRVLVALGGLVISAIFLWLAIRDADPDAVRARSPRRRRRARPARGRGVHVRVSASRRPAGGGSPHAPQLGLRRFYEMVLGGLACNNVLPIRIGEVIRAGWLSREAPMPGGRALGSVALDRVCDVIALVLFLVIGLQAVPTPEWLQRHGHRRGGPRRADRRRARFRPPLHALTRSRPPRARAHPPDRPRHDRLPRRADRPPPGRAVAGAEHRRVERRSCCGIPRRALRRRRARCRSRPSSWPRRSRSASRSPRRPATSGRTSGSPSRPRPPRRSGEPGAGVLDPHARELVRADHVDRRRDHRLAGATDGRAARRRAARTTHLRD